MSPQEEHFDALPLSTLLVQVPDVLFETAPLSWLLLSICIGAIPSLQKPKLFFNLKFMSFTPF